jgi:beta-glucanase (GH16 family)
MLTCLTACVSGAEPENYVLAWSDEFDKDGPLDPKDWSFEQGFVRNRELQWYQPNNALCKDGFLVIEARRERKPNPRYAAGAAAWQASREFIDYTSSSAITRDKHSWTYGRFEIRARIDTRLGSWPAFWTLGVNGGHWPANGEIDIMEYYRSSLLFNIAWARGGNGPSVWNSVWKPLDSYPADWSSKFHVWRMDWDKAAIKLYLDDALVNSQDLSRSLPSAPAEYKPFHGPVYLLINLAIGGQQGGDPSGTQFPVRYELDYVRVYQKRLPASESGKAGE